MGIKQEKPAAPMADKICDSSCNCFVYRNIRTVTFERLTWSLLLLREFTILKIFLWLPVNHSSAICWPRDLYLWPFSCVSCRYLVAVTLPPSSSVMVHFVPGILTLYSAKCKCNYSATSNNSKLVHWPDRWAVTFGTASRGLGGAAARPRSSSLYLM